MPIRIIAWSAESLRPQRDGEPQSSEEEQVAPRRRVTLHEVAAQEGEEDVAAAEDHRADLQKNEKEPVQAKWHDRNYRGFGEHDSWHP